MDKSLEPTKIIFENIPSLKINFTQLKFIIENTLSDHDPLSVLKPFNLTLLENDRFYPP